MSASGPAVWAAPVNGPYLALPAPAELELIKSLSSPSANLSLVFPASGRPADFAYVRVLHGTAPLFEGAIDRQECRLSGGGLLVTLEARDKAAGILDNEAMPRTLWGANLTTVFTRLLAPYGFTLRNLMPSRTLPVFSIYKGQSEWEAFTAFVRHMHGIAPHVDGNCVVVGSPAAGRRLVFSNTKPDGIPFSAIAHSRAPYEMISKICLRDAEGYYSSSVTNPAAQANGVKRVRYLIPPTELADNPGADAKLRIRRAQYGSMKLTLRCPGLLDAAPGREAAVEDALFSEQNLMADEVRLLLGKNGAETEITLRNWLYSDWT